MNNVILTKAKHTNLISKISYTKGSLTKTVNMNKFHIDMNDLFYQPTYVEKKWRDLIMSFKFNNISDIALLDNAKQDFPNDRFILVIIKHYIGLRKEWLAIHNKNEWKRIQIDMLFLITHYIKFNSQHLFGKSYLAKVQHKVYTPLLTKLISNFKFCPEFSFILKPQQRKLLSSIALLDCDISIDDCFKKLQINKWNEILELKYFNLKRASISTIKRNSIKEQYFSKLKYDTINKIFLKFAIKNTIDINLKYE